MKFWLIVNGSVDFCKIEHCLYIGGGGGGSVLVTFEYRKSLKINIFVIFVITQHIKEMIRRKFSGFLRIIR